MLSNIWKWWLFFISNKNVSDSMHFSSLINLLLCKPGKIAIPMFGHEIYKSKHKIHKKKVFKLDVDIFHQKQPYSKLYSSFIWKSNEKGKLINFILRLRIVQIWGDCPYRWMPLSSHIFFQNMRSAMDTINCLQQNLFFDYGRLTDGPLPRTIFQCFFLETIWFLIGLVWSPTMSNNIANQWEIR